MSALVDTQQVTGDTTAPANNNGEYSGGSMMQGSMGPAAMVQLLIYHIMELDALIIKLDQEQKISMIKAQNEEAQAQASSMVKGGKALEDAAIAAGVLTVACAIGSGGLLLGMTQLGEGGRANKDAGEISGKLKPMTEMEEPLKATENEPIKTDEKLGSNENVDKLMEDFGKYDFKNANNNKDDTTNALKQMKSRSQLKKGDDKYFDYDKFKDEFDVRLERKLKEHNTAVNIISTKAAYANTVSQYATSIGGSGSSIAQSVGQAKKAGYDAASTLDDTAKNMAGSSAGESGQAAQKAFDAQNAEVQVLEKIHNTNSVNG